MDGDWSLRTDSMTPPERMKALLSGKPDDRVGLYPFVRGFCAINAGMPMDIFYSDPASLEAQLWTLKMYNHDEVSSLVAPAMAPGNLAVT